MSKKNTISGQSELAGQCTCGALQYQLTRDPLFVHCCHCSWCQKETGSAFAVNVLIETSSIEVTSGELVEDPRDSASGQGQTLWNCDQCGTTMWSHYASAKERVSFIRAGTLNQPGLAPPDIHIFTSTKSSWVLLPDDVPAMANFYRRSEYWPLESQNRYKAALSSG